MSPSSHCGHRPQSSEAQELSYSELHPALACRSQPRRPLVVRSSSGEPESPEHVSLRRRASGLPAQIIEFLAHLSLGMYRLHTE